MLAEVITSWSATTW